MEQRFIQQLQEIKSRREKLIVRYIKLGVRGDLAQDCFDNNLLYIGFWTQLPQVRNWCNEARETDKRDQSILKIRQYIEYEGIKNKSIVTDFTNSVLTVAEDIGNVLWITEHNRNLYYGLTTGEGLESHPDWQDNGPNSGSAKRMKYGWCNCNKAGDILEVNRLSGALTKTAGTKRTIAKIQDKPARYFINHLLGNPLKSRDIATKAMDDLKKSLVEIIQNLRPKEFEVLVDLIFTNSGWKRDGDLGGSIKFVDVTLWLPSTGEKAGVQVKTKTNKSQSQKYIDAKFRDHGFHKFFYVYHTGQAKKPDDDNYFVWDVSEVAKKVIDSGLSQWVIDRSYE